MTLWEDHKNKQWFILRMTVSLMDSWEEEGQSFVKERERGERVRARESGREREKRGRKRGEESESEREG